jgi:hypothetical protein
MVTLSIAAVLTLTAATASAYDYHDENWRVAYTSRTSRDSLDRHINHLNRMVDHVRWQLRHYHAGRQTRREFENIVRDVNRVNWRYQHTSVNRWGLRREVDRLRDRLHVIEDRLHVRSRDYYRWD